MIRLLALLALALPAQAQAPEVDLILNCGTLKGNGTAVVKIYGKTFALLAINCERV